MPNSARQRSAPEAAVSAWQPMSTAPQSYRPILLRSKWAGRPVAIVGVYMREHGAWCTQEIFGHGAEVVNADAWCEIPDLGDRR